MAAVLNQELSRMNKGSYKQIAVVFLCVLFLPLLIVFCDRLYEALKPVSVNVERLRPMSASGQKQLVALGITYNPESMHESYYVPYASVEPKPVTRGDIQRVRFMALWPFNVLDKIDSISIMGDNLIWVFGLGFDGKGVALMFQKHDGEWHQIQFRQ